MTEPSNLTEILQQASGGSRDAADRLLPLVYDELRRPAQSRPLLLARIYDCLPLVCPRCGQAMRIVAFVTEGESVRGALAHVGEPTEAPKLAPSRAPPQGELPWETDHGGEEEFDQRTEHSDEPW